MTQLSIMLIKEKRYVDKQHDSIHNDIGLLREIFGWDKSQNYRYKNDCLINIFMLAHVLNRYFCSN